MIERIKSAADVADARIQQGSFRTLNFMYFDSPPSDERTPSLLLGCGVMGQCRGLVESTMYIGGR